MLKSSKKLLSVVIAVATMLSLSISTMAAPQAPPHVTFENGVSSHFKEIPLEENRPTGGANIQIESAPASRQPRADNTPPVAGLQYVILNPESLINGNITTNTQIAWLWSYNGQNFTYDPDGDAITNISVGGIPSDAIIGTMAGNIGFATQISTPGQYQMTYQVQDARGALSNIVKVVITVEPADGNHRPICQIGYAATGGVLRQSNPLVISWKNSSDPDAGDQIAQVKGLVYQNGSQISTDLLNYKTSSDSDSMVVKFSAMGTYEIWVSVGDTHGAWSDWAIFTVEVKSNQTFLTDVTLNTHYDGTIPDSMLNTYYVDYEESIRLADAGYGPEAILEKVKFKHFPWELPTDQLQTDIVLTGRVTYADGAPSANEEVNFSMPMTRNRGLRGNVYTDANGNFSYSLRSDRYYKVLGYEPGFPYSGDVTGKYTQYAHYSSEGVLFFFPTKFYVDIATDSWSQSVCATAGVSRDPIIGAAYRSVQEGGGVRQWQPYNFKVD